MNADHLHDYRQRCLTRAADLRGMADAADTTGKSNEAHRLSGKASGLDLAVDYLRGYPEDDPARRYSGEFPPGGPDTVDELVAALNDSVTRVRAKYGAAVRVIVAMTGREPEDVLAEMDAAGARLQAEREG